MLDRLRPKLTYANVLSTLAVFIALGGGAYAAVELPPHSVGTKQLKKNAVTSRKVKNHTLKRVDVKAGQFATPAQLVGLNAATLGGIGPGGFVHGAGHVISARFKGTTRTLSPFFAFPGGLVVKLGCSTNGYETAFDNSNVGNESFDLFGESVTAGSPPTTSIGYGTITRNTVTKPTASKETKVVDDDVVSSAGTASVRIWEHFDDTSKTCDVRVRGLSNP